MRVRMEKIDLQTSKFVGAQIQADEQIVIRVHQRGNNFSAVGAHLGYFKDKKLEFLQVVKRNKRMLLFERRSFLNF